MSPVYNGLPVLGQPLHPRGVEVHTVREEFAIRLEETVRFVCPHFIEHDLEIVT